MSTAIAEPIKAKGMIVPFNSDTARQAGLRSGKRRPERAQGLNGPRKELERAREQLKSLEAAGSATPGLRHKWTMLIVSACLLLCSHGLAAGADAKASPGAPRKDVSVYQVQWRCPAALRIGCGSHAKPFLLRLEEIPGVSGAWLNRQGTLVAVVWKVEAKRKARQSVESILKEGKASKLSRNTREKALADFESEKGWYRGAEVDRLSEEEAGVIAARWVRRVQAKTTLTQEKADGLQGALTEGLKKCLTGKAAMPDTEEGKTLELRRVASPFLDEKQIEILHESAGLGMRALPNEE
jgi:hypothetical protein